MRPLQWIVAAAALAVLAVPAAQAQVGKHGYPDRPIKLVVPYGAGGAADLMARLIGIQLGERLGQPVVVENRVGAGGTIGADSVARAEPDGYTFLFTPNGPLVVNPFLMKLPYQPLTAFAPVTLVAEAPNVLAVAPSFPGRTVAEFVAYGKKNPDKLTYATQGIGTTGHITGELLRQHLGLPMTHVAYKGFPPMYTDLVAGRVTMLITDTFNVVPRVRDKELVAIAVAGKTRSSVLPEVPTFAESGYPDVVAGPFFSLVAPAGTPAAIRQRVADEVGAILKQPSVAARFKALGTETRAMDPDSFGVFLRAEYKRWGDIIRSANITIN
jgi:tripartite-type tricarboxylate transporter receptor subunit TctC